MIISVQFLQYSQLVDTGEVSHHLPINIFS